jgi:hypothetical protein
MSFRFLSYDVDELVRCGEAFEREFSTCALSGNNEWTPGLCEWFRNAAADGVRVYPAAGRGKKGEFLVDQCHTTYPLDEPADGVWPSVRWYERSFSASCQMKLALESEWGKWGYADRSLVMVLDDACKLAVLRSSVKVMIFSSHWSDDASRVSTALQKLRACHGDTCPWLWIDVPNDPKLKPGQARLIRHGTLA